LQPLFVAFSLSKREEPIFVCILRFAIIHRRLLVEVFEMTNQKKRRLTDQEKKRIQEMRTNGMPT